MATEFLMPKLGLTMEEGTITEWLVADGEIVEAGAAVLRIETDKTETEVEAARPPDACTSWVAGRRHLCVRRADRLVPRRRRSAPPRRRRPGGGPPSLPAAAAPAPRHRAARTTSHRGRRAGGSSPRRWPSGSRPSVASTCAPFAAPAPEGRSSPPTSTGVHGNTCGTRLRPHLGPPSDRRSGGRPPRQRANSPICSASTSPPSRRPHRRARHTESSPSTSARSSAPRPAPALAPQPAPASAGSRPSPRRRRSRPRGRQAQRDARHDRQADARVAPADGAAHAVHGRRPRRRGGRP